MEYVKIRFCNEFDRLVPELGKTVEGMFRLMNPTFILSERTWKPQMDIYETSGEIFIVAEVAGVNKDDLEIEISSKAVRIYGKRGDVPLEKGTYRLAEIQYGKFERILFLPALIDTNDVTASVSDGFLNIRLIKLPRETRKIPITD